MWEQWGARLCTPGAPGALRWWSEQREWELAELLGLLVERFTEPDDRFSLRFLLSSAVHSAAGGFVEQRIMTAFAAIEHLMWNRLVIIKGMSKTKYKDSKNFPAHEKLSKVLGRLGSRTKSKTPCQPCATPLSGGRLHADWASCRLPRSKHDRASN